MFSPNHRGGWSVGAVWALLAFVSVGCPTRDQLPGGSGGAGGAGPGGAAGMAAGGRGGAGGAGVAGAAGSLAGSAGGQAAGGLGGTPTGGMGGVAGMSATAGNGGSRQDGGQSDGPSACSPNPCQNAGTCKSADGGFACTCAHGFTGSSCELARFLPVPALASGVGVSDDGSTIVGVSAADSSQPARWQVAGTTVQLGVYSGDISSTATALSGDGTIAVGFGMGRTGSLVQALRWSTLSITDLGTLSGNSGRGCRATAVNKDGTVAAGYCLDANALSHSFRVDSNGIADIGMLPGSYYSCAANAMTGDGTTIVGGCTSSAGQHPFSWKAIVMTDLGLLPNATSCAATAISDDTKVVLGTCDATGANRVFRWTSAGMAELTTMPGTTATVPSDTSGDGSVIVGFSSVNGASSNAIMWDQVNGLRTVAAAVQAAGADLTGWTLTAANAITPDGKIIVGTGTNPAGAGEAWLARLP
jgi:uncharacterized membrane protein